LNIIYSNHASNKFRVQLLNAPGYELVQDLMQECIPLEEKFVISYQSQENGITDDIIEDLIN